MLQLFTRTDTYHETNVRTIHDSKFLEVKRKYQNELNRIEHYYKLGERMFPNGAFLVKLIKHLDYDSTFTDLDVAAYIEDKTNSTHRLYNITSTATKGDSEDKVVFINSKCKEYKLAIRDSYNVFELTENPFDYRSVRILDHSFIDFTLKGVEEKRNTVEDDVVIVGIDLLALGMQYRAWANDRRELDAGSSPTLFITSMLLPKLIGDIFDMSIVNYIDEQVNDSLYMEENKFSNKFAVIDYRKKLKRLIDKEVKVNTNRADDYEAYLKQFRSLLDDSLWTSLNLGYLPTNRNNKWLILMSRIKMVTILYKLGSKRGIAANKLLISKMNVYISLLDNDKGLEMFDPLYEMFYLNEVKRIGEQ